MRFYTYIIIILIAALISPSAAAQESAESAESVETAERPGLVKRIVNYFANTHKENNKKFNVSIIGGPHYSSESSFALGLGAEGLYRAAADSSLHFSTASLTSNFSVIGCVELKLKNNLYFAENRWRSAASLRLALLPRHIWGFGFDNGENSSNESKYTMNYVRLNANLLGRVANGLYIGPTISYEFNMGRAFDSAEYDNIQRTSRSYGLGLAVEYDSRDFAANATRGCLISITQNNYTGFDTKPHYRTIFIADWYKRLGPNTVIATDFYTMLNYGKVPWLMYAQMGGSNRMRGYYEGRYTDNNLISFQTELRQKIYRRIGMTAWVGAGNIFGDNNKFCWRHTLPNWGVGFRWEFVKNINIRLDYGMGKRWISGFNFGLEEAF